MLDFLSITTRSTKRGVTEIVPEFKITKSSDIMIRGGDFYAIWVEDLGLWSQDEQDAIQLIDRELEKFYQENKDKYTDHLKVLYLWKASTGMIDSFHKYCQKQMRDNFHMLDEKLIFSNTKTKKTDYASKKLSYPLEVGSYDAYDELMSTLYSPEERRKIEWAIGSIVHGDSKKIQKFLVLYGSAGTGKSTILNIIQALFEGYYSVFDAKSLGSNSAQFALESFKSNPLVAIQHDGDLSKIEDNARLNSLVSHEMMTVNEKFKSAYSNKFKAFLFMGTNRPVKITDAKSGLIRRLIDVTPSGNKLPVSKYKDLTEKIKFELGPIAMHCKDVYLEDTHYYDDYVPISMMGASNDFYNFMLENYILFKSENSTSLKIAWEMYRNYCEDARVPYPLSKMIFKEELKNYFWQFKDRTRTEDGITLRNVYEGFRTDRFEESVKELKKPEEKPTSWLIFNSTTSNFDKECKDCPAQYASAKETPAKKWDEVNTSLDILDTSKLHYVKIPMYHIVIDFDIPDEHGKKCFEKNLEAASKWPPTYAELSKSGAGIHLHYIYTGDPAMLDPLYDEHIEVKVFKGNSALRRKLSKCNDIPIATISSGLKVKKEEPKMMNADTVKSEKGLRALIVRNLKKEILPSTKSSIDFIKKILDDAYESDLQYDVSDMYTAVLNFAADSTNQARYCLSVVDQMKFKSEEKATVKWDPPEDDKIVFYDVEVFPNLFLVNFKVQGKDNPVIRLINPSPKDMEYLISRKLVGFNCRRYDNHIIYARMMGYTNEMLYKLSKKIISGEKDCFFANAYNISYTDIYDFASAGNKKSLKKLEIEMGIHHQELGFDWDQPVPEEDWVKVAEYCDNDVIATEAAFDYLSADFTARLILSDIAKMTPNDTTNSLTTRIIFGTNRTPQGEFCYRNLAEPVTYLAPEVEKFLKEACPDMMSVTHKNDGVHESLLPYFPGYEFKNGVSTYRGETVGEGGWVYAKPGIYINVALLDVSSMHPHSAIAECIFGPRFTKAFREIVEGRVSIKHEAWNEVNDILNGVLTPYIQRVINGEMTSAQLANALKTAINSVYGLTSATFANPFKDPRNRDNIVAKRGALFMINLKNEVEARGYTVAHIKTDSIKIPDADPDIIQFVMDYGKIYGYTFEHEATYERMCLVNDAVYIAKYKDGKHAGEWTATGKQFAVPYVFKTLFSHEEITFDDLCETFAVSKGALYLDYNEKLGSTLLLDKEREKLVRKLNSEKTLESEKIDISARIEEIDAELEKCHDYHFVGRVGQFCPILPGYDACELATLRDGKYYSPPGAKGYKWLESETVRSLGLENAIDYEYYNKLVRDAAEAISEYGDGERDYAWFIGETVAA